MERSGNWLGGSDWHHVLNLEPYGCARMLYYEKTGADPDYPKEITGVMTRGTALEDIIAGLYSAHTGRSLRKRKQYPRNKAPAFWRGSPDRHIVANGDGRGPGILECKSAGSWVFKKMKRQGLPESYILQLQHYLALAGYRWGAYSILSAEDWQFETFEVERDNVILGRMRDAGERFIRSLENGPMPSRLDPSDRRCSSCPYRKMCQGEALLEAADAAVGERDDIKVLSEDRALESLTVEYRELKEIEDEAKERKEDVKIKIKSRMKDLGSDAVQIPGGRLYHQSSVRRTIDPKALRAKHPKIAEEVTREQTVRSLRIFFI